MISIDVKQAIKELHKGNFIVMVDDENRENEGDLVIAAEKITPSKINWILKHARGIMCVPVHGKRLEELGIDLMVEESTDKLQTPFTVTVDAKKETTTGVSVSDRALTIKKLVDKDAKASDFARPGHIFPLKAASNGVLDRAGHTEAAVDICKIAGLYPAAVIAEIMNDDGSMAKMEELRDFCGKHRLGMLTIEKLIEYRKKS